MPIFLFSIVLLLNCGILSAQDLSGRPGAFADINLGLKPLGMGGAYTALAADENAPRWNPALLTRVENFTTGFTWTRQFSLISYNYLTLALPLKSGVGLGAYAVSAGDEVYRETTVGLSAGFPAVKLGIPLERLSVGGSLKIYLASFGNNTDGEADRVTGSAWGGGLDLGLHYQASPTVSLAAVGRDVVNDIKWDSSVKGKYGEGVPTVLALSGAVVRPRMTLGLEYQPGLYNDVPDRLMAGAELRIGSWLRPRLGMAQNLGGGDLNRAVTAGLGLEFATGYLGPVKEVKFGYTHLFHKINPSPRVGIILTW